MSYIVLDTETSGFGSKDAVLQIAYQIFTFGGDLICQASQYMSHSYDFEISERAFNVNGLTKEFLRLNGVWGLDINRTLFNVADSIDDCDLLICHNVAFDWRMLTQEWARYGLFQDDKTVKTRTFCTQNDPSVKAFVGATDKNGRPKAPSLSELHRKLFGCDIDGAHDALADVRATAKCFFELLRLNVIDIQK